MRIYYILKDNYIDSIRIDPNYNYTLEVYPDSILIDEGSTTKEIQIGFFGNSRTKYKNPKDAARDIAIHLGKIILRKHKSWNFYKNVEGLSKKCVIELKKYGVTADMIRTKIT